MSISKINSNLPITTKIEQLNNMILELNGKIAQANFNKNEIDEIYSELGSSYVRKFLRNQGLGNTAITYTDWTHVHAESGYSIWKLSPTNYLFDVLNEVYFNNALVENKGLATSETATAFDKVFLYDGASYIDNTTEAGTETGIKFDLMSATDEFLYIGSASKFYGTKFELFTRGSNYALKVEYYNGSAWVELTTSGFDLTDNTNDFLGDGSITWNNAIDTNWATTNINGSTLYWARISTTEVPAVTASAYYIIPSSSVIGLLALSAEQVAAEQWAWCTYSGAVYITLRNTGNVAYEGSYFVKSSSTDSNKKNFFVYNNSITSNYADSTV